jgi:hypothetical protein
MRLCERVRGSCRGRARSACLPERVGLNPFAVVPGRIAAAPGADNHAPLPKY